MLVNADNTIKNGDNLAACALAALLRSYKSFPSEIFVSLSVCICVLYMYMLLMDFEFNMNSHILIVNICATSFRLLKIWRRVYVYMYGIEIY